MTRRKRLLAAMLLTWAVCASFLVYTALPEWKAVLGIGFEARAATETPPPIATALQERPEDRNGLPIPHLSKKGVQAQISARAEAYGIDPERALRVANCESGFKWYEKNPNSSAAGVFQFIRSTFDSTAARMGEEWTYDEDVFDEMKNIEAAMWLMSNDGFSHWVCK